MLVLAGVSINALVGENGVITQAQRAKQLSDKAVILENLDTELASYNIDTMLGSTEEIKTMLMNLQNKELIDMVLCSDRNYKQLTDTDNIMGIPQFDENGNYLNRIDYAVKKGDYSIILSIDDEGIYKAEYGEVNTSSGGDIKGGTALVTEKAFTSSRRYRYTKGRTRKI